MLTQVAEAALMEKIHKVRTEVMSTGEKTNLGVNVELKRLSAVISTLQVRLYCCFTTALLLWLQSSNACLPSSAPCRCGFTTALIMRVRIYSCCYCESVDTADRPLSSAATVVKQQSSSSNVDSSKAVLKPQSSSSNVLWRGGLGAGGGCEHQGAGRRAQDYHSKEGRGAPSGRRGAL